VPADENPRPYDVADDRTRLRIADLLSGYGSRVKKSVFECVVESGQLERLTERLQGLLEGSDDADIRLYRLCADCYEAAIGLGELAENPSAEPWIVV